MSIIDSNVLLVDKENNWWTCRHVDFDIYGKIEKIGRFPEIIKKEWEAEYKKFIEIVVSEAKINPQIIYYNSDGPIMYEVAEDRVISNF